MSAKLQQGLLFGFVIFVSAFLLFQLQPLISKYILPWYGGTPSVWTTALLFFQLFLVAGYAYAHFSVRYLSARKQAILHIALLLAAAALLPITPDASWKPVAALQNPTGPILLLLTCNVGLAYFLLASTSPLLQAWYSRAHVARSPYRFYALSNVGSLLALLSYPFVFEPGLTLKAQVTVWSVGFVVFGLAGALAAVLWWRADETLARSRRPAHPGSKPTERNAPNDDRARPRPRQWLLWLTLPAAGSVMLLAITNQITLQVAVVPFLWILPLSLYLLSFILCFESRRFYSRVVFVPALTAAMLVLLYLLARTTDTFPPLTTQIALYAGILFVCCMVCHGELVRVKPHPTHLTFFYLMIAVGGALGGIFVALLAPQFFSFFFELHFGAMLCLVLLFVTLVADRAPPRRRAWRFAAGVFVAVTIVGVGFGLSREAIDALTKHQDATRNFYGVAWVVEQRSGPPDEHVDVLVHDGVAHGSQHTASDLRCRPTTYYVEHSGAGMAIRFFPRRNLRIGAVGMGIGVLATFTQPGDVIRFYEINPAVARLAARRFSFISECAAAVEVILGDGRLSLEREAAQAFDILVLDAFRGDALPVHLLTREAFEIYLRHLRPDGVIAVHLTNSHFNLKPVFWKMADHFGLQSLVILSPYERKPDQLETSFYDVKSSWMLMTNNSELLASLPGPSSGAIGLSDHAQVLIDFQKGSAFVVPETDDERALFRRVRLWSDDYSNPFQLLENLEPGEG